MIEYKKRTSFFIKRRLGIEQLRMLCRRLPNIPAGFDCKGYRQNGFFWFIGPINTYLIQEMSWNIVQTSCVSSIHLKKWLIIGLIIGSSKQHAQLVYKHTRGTNDKKLKFLARYETDKIGKKLSISKISKILITSGNMVKTKIKLIDCHVWKWNYEYKLKIKLFYEQKKN